MKSKSVFLGALILSAMALAASAAPLRVFIRGGAANRGEEVHAHPRFLAEWTKLLTDRGMQVQGSTNLPTAEELAKTDVLIMYAQDGGAFPAAQRPGFEAFLKRGGGLVVLHTATVPTRDIPDGAAYWKSIIGGSWVQGTTKWLEGPMSFYYVDRTHPISQGTGNFDIDDEIYYDMDMDPRAHVLGAAYTPNTSQAKKADTRGQPTKGKVTVYDIAPQMWTFENTLDGGSPYRAFVSIPGHRIKTFEHLAYRAVLMRGIAWAGKRSNIDEFAKPEELAALRYPAGGAPRPEQIPPTLVVHPEFKVSLVASEPLVNKVINMDWDAQGRLWVVETPEYPDGRAANAPSDYVQRWQRDDKQKEDGTYDRPAFDRISTLTDTNGDGKMDKKQVFADFEHGVPGGLERANSFVFYKDGVIVSAAPLIWLLRDTDGDGVCDKAEVLYKNLGDRDTHAVINNMRWGYDGWIYATHGYSSTPDVKSGDGSKGFGPVGSGVVRFKPDGSAFEQFSSKGGNTWGLQISWDNEVFWTQPTSGDLVMHTVMNEGQLAKAGVKGLTSFHVVRKSPKSFSLIPYDQLPYVQIDWVGSFTAAAGTVIYDGGTWPEKWNYSYFCTEPTINLIHQEFVKADGVSYFSEKESSREDLEFIAGKNLWFRPIEVRTGPDGAMYIVDFCNQAIIHNDTRGPKHGPHNAAIRPDRDHYYSRIWRVDHKDAKTLVVPNLAKADGATLVKALETVNDNVRADTVRLISERAKADVAPALKQLVTSQKTPQSRVAAMWALQRIGQMDAPTLLAANTAGGAMAKNAMMIAAENAQLSVTAAAVQQANGSNPRLALEALKALAVRDISAGDVKTLVQEVYPKLNDPYLKAAFMVVANRQPSAFLEASFGAPNAEAIAPLVAALTTALVGGNSTDDAAKLVVALAGRPAEQDTLKQALLTSLGTQSKGAPKWTAELEGALKKLLSSPNTQLAASALPLTVHWDTDKHLADDVKREVGDVARALDNGSLSDDARANLAATLIEVRTANPQAMPAVTKLLGAGHSAALQTRVVETLGTQIGAEIGNTLVKALPGMTPDAQSAALNQLIKRPVWSMALLDALDTGAVPSNLIGPANIYRLRTHANAGVSKRANELMDKLRGPEAKEKDSLIAKLTPEVEKKGDPVKGKEIFTANCATCHRIDELGNNVGPNLTGMGAHGPAELLVSIIDPNREVDFSFVAWSVETKDGETYDGIIARENGAMVAMRNAQGEKEIAVKDIKSKRSTGRSLMPEGFEALGAETLRDLLAFICKDAARFRFVDLSHAYTANTRDGLYMSKDANGGQLPLARSGVISAFGVPFNVLDPAKVPNNVMVLKGGDNRSISKRDQPQSVEAKLGFEAKQLHILGNVGGWAFPYGGETTPVLKITATYVGGATEVLTFNNGVEFADYIREVDVSGSKLVKGLAADGKQVRYASRKLKGQGVVEKLTFESFNNGVAPTTLAVTADLSADPLPGQSAAAAAPAPAAPAEPFKWGPGTKVLLVGGGSSHDFERFFNKSDTATLTKAGFSVNYTEDGAVTARELAKADVAVLSVNRPGWATPELRTALSKFVDAGKGLVLLHPGVWYNFKDWPEYNKVLAGGGSRGHDKPLEFEVKAINTTHPVMKGVSPIFKITDELYWFEHDAAGTDIEELARTHSPQKDKDYPMVWVVKHPKTRIAGIALGHDERAHDLPDYQRLLINAVTWTSGK